METLVYESLWGCFVWVRMFDDTRHEPRSLVEISIFKNDKTGISIIPFVSAKISTKIFEHAKISVTPFGFAKIGISIF